VLWLDALVVSHAELQYLVNCRVIILIAADDIADNPTYKYTVYI